MAAGSDGTAQAGDTFDEAVSVMMGAKRLADAERALIARIVGLFRSVDSRDWTGMLTAYHEDARYERPGYPPLMGHVEILNFYAQVRALAAGEHRLERIIVTGDHAACWGTFVGLARNGRSVEEMFCDVYIFEEDRIKTRRTFFFRPAI
jgi:ketosteroid isomerase-like protein